MSSLLSGIPNAPHPVVEGFGLALQDKDVLTLIHGILNDHASSQDTELSKVKRELEQAQAKIKELEAKIKQLEGR